MAAHPPPRSPLEKEDFLRQISRSPELGSGVFGDVRRWEDVAVKVICCEAYLECPREMRVRSEHTDGIVAKLLWEHVALPGLSPHLLAPYTEPNFILPDVLPQRQYSIPSPKDRWSSILAMEYAPHGTVHAFLHMVPRAAFDQAFLAILFQVCFTLHRIHQVFPTFRHNDCSDSNIFLLHSEHPRPLRYLDPETGRRWILPEGSPFACIGDFGASAIQGLVDNAQTIEISWNAPSWHINQRTDHGSDLYFFVNTCVSDFKDRLSATLLHRLQTMYYGHLQLPKNGGRVPGHIQTPSATHVLRHTSLFAEFLSRPTNPISSPPPSQKLLFPHWLREWEGDRLLPVFYERQDPKQIPARTLYESLPLLLTYKGGGMREPDVLPWISELFLHEFEDRDSVYFNRLFWPRLWLKATTFMERMRNVPPWTWPCVVTCAFVDCVWELGIAKNNRRYMDTMEWVQFWRDKAEIEETRPLTTRVMREFALQWEWARQEEEEE